MTAEHPSKDPIAEMERLCGHEYCKGKGSYTVAVVCRNCGFRGTIRLTKGHEFTSGHSCPTCECSFTLMRT